MNNNTTGRLFSFTSWGESHGPAVGCVVDGCPPGLALSEADIQPSLDRRRPGRNARVSGRDEEDRVAILSGVHEGITTGHPIMLLVKNRDHRPEEYAPLRHVFRPGHADAVYQHKYGVRDPRGGGRASARETVARVAAGAVAARLLAADPATRDVAIRAGLIALGPVAVADGVWDEAAIDANPFFCPDPAAAAAMDEALARAIDDGTSLGGLVEIRARGVPPGLGEPVYDRLDGRIGQLCLGLNAVKGVEIGDGFAVARREARETNDAMRRPASGRLGDAFVTNHAGGILGGISTGADIVVRCALKPTPSIAAGQRTVTDDLVDVDLAIAGRHDPALAIRAVPVLEATMAVILADFVLLARARGWDG